MRLGIQPIFWRYLIFGFLIVSGICSIIFGLLSPGFMTELLGLSPEVGIHEGTEVGSLAPDFRLISISGDVIHLSQFQGKPVVVNFWATWCTPCVVEMPNLQKIYEEHDKQFEILAVNAGESEFTVKQFAKAIGIDFLVLLDPDFDIQSRYKIRGYPTTFVLDADGVVQAQHIGILGESQLEEYLELVGMSK